MTLSDIRVALIGGRGHQFIAAGFGKIEGLRLAAVAADGLDDAARRNMKADYCGPDVKWWDDYRAMLDAVKPDVAYVGAWPAKNGPIIIEALRRGIHVISDKPIVDNRRELAEIQAILAKRPDLMLLTEFDMRARKVFRAMREAVRGGKVGEVVLVTGQKSYRFGESRPDFYKTREGYPGSFAFIGCHLLDLSWYVTGLRIASAEGLQGNVAKKDYGRFEDHAAMVARLENGGTCVLHVDYLRPQAAPTHGDDRLRVAGSEGVIEVRDNRCVLITHKEGPVELCAAEPGRMDAAEELVRALRGQGAGCFGTAESLYMAEVMLRVREALDTGRKVAV